MEKSAVKEKLGKACVRDEKCGKGSYVFERKIKIYKKKIKELRY